MEKPSTTLTFTRNTDNSLSTNNRAQQSLLKQLRKKKYVSLWTCQAPETESRSESSIVSDVTRSRDAIATNDIQLLLVTQNSSENNEHFAQSNLSPQKQPFVDNDKQFEEDLEVLYQRGVRKKKDRFSCLVKLYNGIMARRKTKEDLKINLQKMCIQKRQSNAQITLPPIKNKAQENSEANMLLKSRSYTNLLHLL